MLFSNASYGAAASSNRGRLPASISRTAPADCRKDRRLTLIDGRWDI